MKKERIDIAGNRYGRLVVASYSHTNKHGKAMWLCNCDCGKTVVVESGNLRSCNTTSCGCLHREHLIQRETKHKETGNRLYWIWHGMKARCSNHNEPSYKRYGGRGIKVCDEWKDYLAFREWAINNGYSDKLTIDRIDVNGNYEPSNCRWATTEQQANNKRTNRYITHNGKTQTIKQWADELGINYYTLYSRIVNRKWNIEKALYKGN